MKKMETLENVPRGPGGSHHQIILVAAPIRNPCHPASCTVGLVLGLVYYTYRLNELRLLLASAAKGKRKTKQPSSFLGDKEQRCDGNGRNTSDP